MAEEKNLEIRRRQYERKDKCIMNSFIIYTLCHKLFNIVRVIKSKRMRWAGHVARMVEGRGVYRVLVGRPLGIPRHRWEDNIKLDLREIGIDGANWIPLVQDRVQWRALVNTVMNLLVP
jgi:hypothetical protein